MPNYIGNGIKELSKNHPFFFRKLYSYFSFFIKKTKHLPQPLNYQIEPTSLCNLSCKMCAVKNDHSRFPPLSIKNFNRLLKHLLPIESANLSGLGEPLLNPNLEYFIEKLSQKNVYCFTISNAQLLTKNRIDSLIASGLNSIIVSQESADPKQYEQIRQGASFTKLRQNLDLLSQKTAGHSNFSMILNTVLLSQIDPRLIRQLINFASQNKIPYLNFFVADNVIDTKTLVYFQKNPKKIRLIYKKIFSYAKSKSISINLPSLSLSRGRCTSPWLFPYISVSGDVFPCCALLHLALADGQKRETIIKKYSLGNIFTSHINQIWNSPKAVLFRQSFVNKKYNKYCLLCSKFYSFK